MGLRLPIAAVAVAIVATSAPAGAATPLGPGPGLPDGNEIVIGRSVNGKPITAYRVGDPAAPRKGLVVGNIHGDEPEGLRVTRMIGRKWRDLKGIDLWVIHTVNPDGLGVHRRQNAHGVDLNRNFGKRWRRTGPRGSRYYAGRRAFTEPESRAMRALVRLLRPAVTVWYHQPFGHVIPPPFGGDLGVVRDYARLTDYTVRTPLGAHYTGTATMWENAIMPDSTAFVVELPARPVTQRRIARHARAAVSVARLGRDAHRR
jgi:murein peptide amidase A